MLPGARCGDGHFVMQKCGRRNEYGLHCRIVQQRFPIAGATVYFQRCANGIGFLLRGGGQRHQMSVVRGIHSAAKQCARFSCADDAYANDARVRGIKSTFSHLFSPFQFVYYSSRY